MHWLLIGYMFLFIDRPFEVWPILGDMRFERIYMFGTITAWFLCPGKRWISNSQHLAYAAFAFAVLACWAISPWSERSQPLIEDYFKVLVFYILLVTTVHDEKGLKRMVVGFVVVMGLYLMHSFREYIGGRHTYRMGISRMIGVDSTLGDPNSFGASIVFALPFIVALWRTGIGGRWGKLLLVGYFAMSTTAILLTGSRSSLLGLLFWVVLVAFQIRRGWLWIILLAALSPIAFAALPESLQTRFETIIDSDVGPENAKESGEGRILGLMKGLDLWASNPLTGVGPGAWRPATKSQVESHNLYGQLLGELGTMGAITFGSIVFSFWKNTRKIARIRRAYGDEATGFPFQVASAVGTGVVLLLFMGNFGHNLFRFTWLWYGGFLIVAAHCIKNWVQTAEYDATLEDEAVDSNDFV